LDNGFRREKATAAAGVAQDGISISRVRKDASKDSLSGAKTAHPRRAGGQRARSLYPNAKDELRDMMDLTDANFRGPDVH